MHDNKKTTRKTPKNPRQRKLDDKVKAEIIKGLVEFAQHEESFPGNQVKLSWLKAHYHITSSLAKDIFLEAQTQGLSGYTLDMTSKSSPQSSFVEINSRGGLTINTSVMEYINDILPEDAKFKVGDRFKVNYEDGKIVLHPT